MVQVKEKMRHNMCQMEYSCSGGNDSLIQQEEKLTEDTYPLGGKNVITISFSKY